MYYFLKCEWFIGFDYDLWLLYSMFWGVSNYSLLAMERTNFCIFLFLAFLSLLCNSEDYKYDNYKYNEYNYDDENYDYYHDKKSEDYTEELNDYHGHQNLLAPAPLQKPQSPTSYDCSMCLDFNYIRF